MDQITQEEYEKRSFEISRKISELNSEIRRLEAERIELNKQAWDIEDKHSLIPKQYNSVAEWADGHPFPDTCHKMVFKNKEEARNVQLCCNTYQEYYHILREKQTI